jgi:osmotically inducible lipoprotein OsmB
MLDMEVFEMNTIRLVTVGSIAIAVLLGLSGCSGMSRQGQNTATGAAVGGVAGAVLTGGSSAGTVGGAVVGGVIGHEVNKTK